MRHRPPRRGLLLVLIGAGLVSATARAQGVAGAIDAPQLAADPRVTVQLHAAGETFEPGKPMWVGVRFDIEPQWHIYWHNPGDAGLATSLDWSLPPGWTASRIHWPLPRRFTDFGGLRAFGYEEQVVLLTRITPPADASPVPAAQAPLSVRAQWLACRDRCVLGEAAVAADAVVVDAELIGQWRRLLPVDVNADPRVLDVKTQMVTSTGELGQRAVVAADISWAADITGADWYPHAPRDAEIVDVVTTTSDRRTRIEATVQGLSPRFRGYMTLPGVLVYHDTDGTRRGVLAALELRTSEPAEPADSP